MTIRSGSGRDEVREAVECAFLGEQLVGILEALAALRDLAQRGIDRFGKTPQCCQCLEDADELLAEERALDRFPHLVAA